MAVDADLGQPAVELRPPLAVVPPRELVDDEPADVVPVARVLAPGVAEAGDEQVVRGAVTARPEPHGGGYSSAAPDRRRHRRPHRLQRRRLRRQSRRPRRRLRPRRARSTSRRRRRDGREHGLVRSSSSVTPSGTASADRRSESPIPSAETSNSRCSGTSIGSASTFSSFVTCERTPPSFMPTASPMQVQRHRGVDRLVEPHFLQVDVRDHAAHGIQLVLLEHRRMRLAALDDDVEHGVQAALAS